SEVDPHNRIGMTHAGVDGDRVEVFVSLTNGASGSEHVWADWCKELNGTGDGRSGFRSRRLVCVRRIGRTLRASATHVPHLRVVALGIGGAGSKELGESGSAHLAQLYPGAVFRIPAVEG